MMEIVVASKNAGKIAEFTAAFAELPVKMISLAAAGNVPDAEEVGNTFAENALDKAKFYFRYTGKACLADDSGLEVDALGGAPGVYSARYSGPHATDQANNEKLLADLAGVPAAQRTARFRCVLVFYDPNGATLMADGTCEGVILSEPRGTGGFGYDPLFYIPELGRTLAELSVAEKNRISHRGRAIRSMRQKLAEHVL